jgi:hypothetical protein
MWQARPISNSTARRNHRAISIHISAVKYASPTSGRIEDWEWLDHGAGSTMPVQGRVTVNSAEAYIACCACRASA